MRLFTLSILFVVTVLVIAFDARKCEHKFTAVEQPVIKIEQPSFWQGGYIIPEWPTGLKEGKELLCARCGLVQRQVLDYGPAPSIPNSTLINIDTIKFASSGFLKIDSCNKIYWESIR